MKVAGAGSHSIAHVDAYDCDVQTCTGTQLQSTFWSSGLACKHPMSHQPLVSELSTCPIADGVIDEPRGWAVLSSTIQLYQTVRSRDTRHYSPLPTIAFVCCHGRNRVRLFVAMAEIVTEIVCVSNDLYCMDSRINSDWNKN